MSNLSFYTKIFEDFEVLNDTGVLSNERLKEIKDFISKDKFIAPRLEGGKTIKDWVIHEPTGSMFTERALADSEHYVYCRCLKDLLTEEEIASLNKYASSAYSAKKEAERLTAATKIVAIISEDGVQCEYDGAVYDPCNDSYYNSIDDFLEQEGDDIDFNDEVYLWACNSKRRVFIDADNVIANSVEEVEELYSFETRGTNALIKAIDDFNKANEDAIYWEADYLTSIVLKRL